MFSNPWERKASKVNIVASEIPYLHDKIKTKHLKRENGKVLSEEMIGFIKLAVTNEGRYTGAQVVQLIKAKLNGDDGYDERELKRLLQRIECQYDIIYSQGKYFADYAELSQGGHSETHLGQALDSGEGVVIKSVYDFFGIEHELELLEATGIAILGDDNKPIHHGQHIIMKLMPGVEMDDLHESYDENSFADFDDIMEFEIPSNPRFIYILQAVISLIDDVYSLHEKKHIIHGDIKGPNVLCDLLQQCKSKLIDYGHSYKMNNDGYAEVASFNHTAGYDAPEFVKIKLPNGNDGSRYTREMDIFALAVTMARCFGFTDEDFFYPIRIIDKSHPYFKFNPHIPNLRLRHCIYDFISHMQADDPKLRPNIKEIRRFFRAIRDKYLDSLTKTTRVGLVKVKDCEEMLRNPDNHLIFLTNLNAFDQIWFVDEEKDPTDTRYLFLMRDMKACAAVRYLNIGAPFFDLKLTRNLLSGGDPDEIIKRLPSHMEQRYPTCPFSYSYSHVALDGIRSYLSEPPYEQIDQTPVCGHSNKIPARSP